MDYNDRIRIEGVLVSVRYLEYSYLVIPSSATLLMHVAQCFFAIK